MQRVVSDKTHEYPDNENHTFKVRLPAPLHLSGHGWEVALIRLVCLRLVIDIMLYWAQVKKSYTLIFVSTKEGTVQLGCQGFMTPQGLLEVGSGLDMMKI